MKLTMIKNILMIAAVLLMLESVISHAGTNKIGGSYEVLMDVTNARGGESTGGAYTVLSSIGQRFLNGDAMGGGSYVVASGIMGAVDAIPPSIAFSSPSPNDSASGTIAVVGTAFDNNDLTWTLYVGPGNTPSTWKELASGTGNQAANYNFGAWDSSNYSGAYTFKIEAVDGHGNTSEGTITVGVDYTFTIAGTIPDLKWIFFGIPVEVSNADTMKIFGDGVYKVYRWDPAATPDQYMDQYKYPSKLNPGDGFWIKSYGGDMPYSFSGSPVETNQESTISVKKGWNQIASPFNKPFPVSSVQVKKGEVLYSLADAAQMGLVSSNFSSYDYDKKSWIPSTANTQMQPNQGFYVQAFEAVTLVFNPDSRVLSRIVRQVEDYSVNISATVSGRSDAYNLLGAAKLSETSYDSLDAQEPPVSMDSIEDELLVSLYFPHEDWEEKPGRYAKDFRPSALDVGDTEEWTFIVETNQPGSAATITWDNTALPADRYSFTLTNPLTEESIDMTKRNSFAFVTSPEAITRNQFSIQATRTGEGGTLLTKKHSLKPGWNLIAVPVEPEVTSALKQLGDDMATLNVFQYFDGKFYAGESADIQAGIGYWVHVDDETEIDITGHPVKPQITVPLKKGWNIIGNPFEKSLKWGDNITVTTEAGSQPLSAAIKDKIVDGKLYASDGTNYHTLTPPASLEPWTGYIINATIDCSIILSE